MSVRHWLGATALALFAVTTPASADEVKLGSLVLSDLWTRATPPGAPTAGGFLTITNTGSEADRLTGAASPLGSASLHQTVTENGIASMRPVGAIEIPAGGKVVLEPGSFHIMIEGLSEPLQEGGKAPVTLTFEHAGSVDAVLQVLAVGAAGVDAMSGMGGMQHGTGQ